MQQDVQRLLAQFLVVAAAEAGGDAVHEEVAVPVEVGLVKAGRGHEVAHDGEERVQVVDVHFADEHRHLLVGLRPDRRRPRVQRLGDFLEGHRRGAAAAEHQRGEGVQPVLAGRVVHRAGPEPDPERDEGRIRHRQLDDGRVAGGPAASGGIRRAARGEGAGQEERRRDQRRRLPA